MIVDKLEDLVGKTPVLVTIAYVHVQDWGIFALAESNICETREQAEQWLAEQSQARAVYWSDIRQLPTITSVETIRELSIVSLQSEKAYMRQKMAEGLAKIDERIENLRALPAPAPSAPTIIPAKKQFVLGFISSLTEDYPLDLIDPFLLVDEENNEESIDSFEHLPKALGTVDFETLHINFLSGDRITLALTWENEAPDTIADYGAYADNGESSKFLEAINKHFRDYTKHWEQIGTA